MIVELTKRFVIDAIEREPATRLETGQWYKMPKWWMRTGLPTVRSRDCKVCAVGAVMRRALYARESMDKVGVAAMTATQSEPSYGVRSVSHLASAETQALDLLKRGSPMCALSTMFEVEGREASTDDDYAEVKKTVIAFVRKHFPARMRVDIGECRPAADVKVVDRATRALNPPMERL